ncbi:ATP-binding protein [Sphaerisporangium sp. NPDC088356]|uniref:ATP-binding protein n=1 Tax=Sphaerisporangium sp. NPDC088356 TaxID=3154871 RepID=UPI00342CB147
MEVTIALRLPRDAASVSVTRQILGAELEVLGVEQVIKEDIQLMLTEACSNVITHASETDEYTVSAQLIADKFLITVVDTGNGFDPDKVGARSPLAEHGRGLQIMRALADDVRFMNRPKHGAIVCLEKALRYVRDSPGELLTAH